MLIEVQRFIEFDRIPALSRADLKMEAMAIETKYIASAKRYRIWGDLVMTEVLLTDWGTHYVIDMPYEEVVAILRKV